MTFAQFLLILRARKWLVLGVFAFVVLGVVGASLVWTKKYTGEASVVIDVKPDPVSMVLNPAAAAPSFMATQIDIMSSDRVTLRVIRDLKLAQDPSSREQWQNDGEGKGTLEQYLVEYLQKFLDIRPSRESNVISIAYRSPDPKFAAALANAFAQAYIATTLELRTNSAQNFKNFFDAQTKEARDSLERAQAKLSAYQQEKGIIATDERLDVENARLIELSSQLTQLQAIRGESASREQQAQGAKADRLQEVINNPVIGGLKVDINRAEAKLQELAQRLGDANPQVIEAKANITELRARLDAETKRISSGVGVSNTINQAREGQVRASLEAQRTRIMQMKAVRDEGVVLQREAENAQKMYDSLIARVSQTALEAQNTQSYANILTVAQPPAQHSSPRLLLNAVLAIFVGLFLSVGVALLLEMLDRRVRSPEDIAHALGLPVIGVVPTPTAKRYKPALSAASFKPRPAAELPWMDRPA
ncbi:chain length determinant protein EpsF [Pelomonas sp. HMWF004]|nr:chain length determinant protein EpsF [Pelomonas sp. HMWF004]